jgi:hypothetical protein
MSPEKNRIPYSSIGGIRNTETGAADFWPPRVVWAREMGWLRVRDQWGKWHEILAKEAPDGYPRLATLEKR